MNIGALRPAYATRRLGQILFQRRHPDAPWLTASAVLLLDNWLKIDDVGLEWGSGRSTCWLARRVRHLTSVENNPKWHARVTEMLRETGVAEKVDYRFVESSAAADDRDHSDDYVKIAEAFADASLDFALVDGRLRLPCLTAVIPKLKPGGLLILDNANRYVTNTFDGGNTTVHEPADSPRDAEWAAILDQLASWRWINTSDGIWDTRFWIKPH